MNQKFRKDSGWGDPTAGLVPSEGSFLFVSGPGLGGQGLRLAGLDSGIAGLDSGIAGLDSGTPPPHMDGLPRGTSGDFVVSCGGWSCITS